MNRPLSIRHISAMARPVSDITECNLEDYLHRSGKIGSVLMVCYPHGKAKPYWQAGACFATGRAAVSFDDLDSGVQDKLRATTNRLLAHVGKGRRVRVVAGTWLMERRRMSDAERKIMAQTLEAESVE